ncbi:hypothetical protein [Deinococcus rufus]|uniref:Uncharacterized protein n=1 Tax=Deinococcus rufus TaxID=2136097 RepID=A0ABV7ZAU7_9DEIO
MHLMILTADSARPTPAAGQPLRGATESFARGRRTAWLVGAMTHQCTRRALIAEVPLDPQVVERALLASYAQAFPGLQDDPETLAGLREVHSICADSRVGSVVTPVVRGFQIRPPDAVSVAAAAALVEGAVAGLLALAAGTYRYVLGQPWPSPR